MSVKHKKCGNGEELINFIDVNSIYDCKKMLLFQGWYIIGSGG